MTGNSVNPAAKRPSQRRRRACGKRVRPALIGLTADRLEPRQLLAGLTIPALVSVIQEARPSDTLDLAQSLGDLSTSPAGSAAAAGVIGRWADDGSEVDWYSFTLDSPASVSLTTGPAAGSAFQGVVSLYNNDASSGDPLDPIGHRLMAQSQASAPGALSRIDATLATGTYYVAISGAGNRDFHPLIADSGLAGSTGAYSLLLTSSNLKLAPGGPVVISSDPVAGAALDRSPLAIRLGLSAALDPSTLTAGQTVRLLYNRDGQFGNGQDTVVALSSVNYSATANELQLFPQRALAPGSYEVVLSGDTSLSQGNPVVASAPDDTPLGTDASHPNGRDFIETFRVTGIEGGTTADDTLATSHNLGDVTGVGVVRATGAIGADPFYDPTNPVPSYYPGNGVNMYRFHVSGTGRFALVAEAFAGRIGSPLDPGLALYRVDPADNSLHFVAGDNNTLNATVATDGSTPLQFDAALFASLTGGDYVIAVSSGLNTPSPLEQQALSASGLYDPNVSHSGQNGFSTGPYVLNLRVERETQPPRVVATSPYDTQPLAAAPSHLTVRFSEAVNLEMLAFAAFQSTTQTSISQAYVVGSDGTPHVTRLESYNKATNTATFLMLDRLPSGSYEFHLSGPSGLTDLSGNPLKGNTTQGDYVVRFTVGARMPGVNGDPLSRTVQGDPTAQNLGAIFPLEWQAGVVVTRNAIDPSKAPASVATATQDTFQFQVFQEQHYAFSVEGTLPAGTSVWLNSGSGHKLFFGFAAMSRTSTVAVLKPGVYTVHVGHWAAGDSAGVSYRLTLKLVGEYDFPPPLVSGPAPALQLRLDNLSMPPTPGPFSATPSANPGSSGGADAPPPNGDGSSSVATPTAPPASAVASSTASITFQASPSTALVALAAGPVGDVQAAPGRSSTGTAPVQLSLGGTTPALAQGLVKILTFIEGFDAGSAGEAVIPGDVPTGPAAVFDATLQRVANVGAEVDAPAGEPAGPVLGSVSLAAAAPVADASNAEAAAVSPDATTLPTDPSAPTLAAGPIQGPEKGADEPLGVSRAGIGWSAGLMAFGALTVACLRRYRPGRLLAAKRGLQPDEGGATPGRPIGLNQAARRTVRGRSRKWSRVQSPAGQAT
jgi:methionine-rich copper-binding protein CopC